MPKIEYNIFEISDQALNPVDSLSSADTNLVESFEIKNVFSAEKNFIELNFFSLQNNLLLSDSNYTNYSILQDGQSAGKEGASIISVDVLADVKAYGYSLSDVKLVYNFLNNVYSESSQANLLYLDTISPDRTEVRLLSTTLTDEVVETKTLELLAKIQSSAYLPEFSLYSGNNNYITAINIGVQDYNGKKAVVLKLYQPLASSVQLKDTFTVVEKICDSPAYQSDVTITPDAPVIPTLRSPNFSIEVDEQSTEPTEYFNYNELFSFPTNNTYRQLNSLFAEKGAELGVDYSEYSNYINFSSAEERVRNFKYKVQLVESYQTSLDSINTNLTNYTGTGVVGSREYFEGLINGVLDNFDHYERHLYYDSGSTSWPKENTSRPYVNVDSTTGAAITWFNTEVTNASNYDLQNPDILINSIPSYLKEDPSNDPYLLFIHMIGQHFDNLWLYTDVVSKKYDADNRLNRGVPKDLVEDLLKNFGVKLYTSNKSAQDLFRYFTADSYQIDDLEPNLEPIITGSNYSTSQNDYQKEIYKRIYHNLPLLMKSKGTERGLRALINCFGIPSETLKINLYGGQSSQNTPFFGGEQAWTGSLDKVRLDNTGSIVEGDTLSQYTAITKLDNFYTQDLHTIEVGFSPTHNVDTYILSQSAVLFPSSSFNIDDYIGDPREINTNTYFSLRDYADEIFTGVDSYDLKDFVRFIKFFDNVIFRMVRDFIPARAVADTGIIIKPHLLERSKYESPVMSWTQPEYTGSIDTAFITGSSGGAYESHAFGSVNGSLVTSYTETVQTPTGDIVHSWVDSRGNISYVRGHEEARFDGQLGGSHIVVTDGELNRDNNYKNLDYSLVKYNVYFYKDVPPNVCIIGSLSQAGNPYIIRPNESPYDLSSLFLNGNLQEFDYTVDSTVVPNPGSYIFFSQNWLQYEQALVNATKSTDASCTATTLCTKVDCTATVRIGTIPQEFVYTDTTYNLNTWFIPNDNYQSSIYVKYEQGGFVQVDPENYQFQGSEGELVDIKLQDDVDSTCQVIRSFTIKECSLDFNPSYVSFSSTDSYLNAAGDVVNQSNFERSYYNVATAFNGVVNNQPPIPEVGNTIFNVIFYYDRVGADGTVTEVGYGPTRINTYTTNGVPLLESLSLSTVETRSSTLEEVYPAFRAAMLANGVSNDEIENSAVTAVELIARTPNPGGINCTTATNRIPIPGPGTGVGGGQWETLSTGGTMKFKAQESNGAYQGVCSAMESLPAPLYYILPDGETPGATQVLANGWSLYKSQDSNPANSADAGRYAVWYSYGGGGFPIPQGQRIKRDWNGQGWIQSSASEC